MDLQQALAAFPANSPFRQVLPLLLDDNEITREKGLDRLNELDVLGADPMATTWSYPEDQALGLFSTAVTLPFPPSKKYWKDVVHDLIFPLVRSPYPSLASPAGSAYPRLSSRAKCAVLSLLGACGTRQAAEVFMTCIREHGWPESVYGRVYNELPKLLDHADVLFPELIVLAGPFIAGVTDVFISGIGQKKIDLANHRIDPIAPLVAVQMQKALDQTAPFQSDRGVEWRFSEDYTKIRQDAGCWLDIAGYLKSPALMPLLAVALKLSDPMLLAYAVGSVLRLGGEIDGSMFERIAACHESRGHLFGLLDALGRMELFPSKWRTWSAFAAANMVDWLLTETGRETDELEQMAEFTAMKPDGKVALFVWRFRTGEGPWYAATSGPHLLEGDPKPVHGNSTFSRFDEWDTATAEQHAEAVLETLADWRKSWENESRRQSK